MLEGVKIKTIIGDLFIGGCNNKISLIKDASDVLEYVNKSNEVIELAINEIYLYLEGKIKYFSFEVEFEKTEFTKKVYEELKKVGYGSVVSYKDLAKSSGDELASRAVGNVMAKNELLLYLPCHRIIKSNNKIGSYKLGVNSKEFLINLEKNNK